MKLGRVIQITRFRMKVVKNRLTTLFKVGPRYRVRILYEIANLSIFHPIIMNLKINVDET